MVALQDMLATALTLAYLVLTYLYLRWIPFSPLSTLLPVLWGLVWIVRGGRHRGGRWTIARRAVTTLALLPVLDFTWRPYFLTGEDLVYARIGAVDHRSARLSIRGEGWDSLHLVSVGGREARQQGIAVLKDDGVVTFTLEDLSPATEYEYKLQDSTSGEDLKGRFKTFPDPSLDHGQRFSFATSSCIKPNFPYSPFREPLTIPGLDIFAKEELENNLPLDLLPRFLLFLGDFIYADVPYYFGERLYKQLYRQIYASPSYRKIYSKIPTLHIYDDHEVLNNWASNTTAPFPAAFDAYQVYNGEGNPIKSWEESWYDFKMGQAAAFFVMDTRRYRDVEEKQDGPDKSMLGEMQLADLLDWAAKVNQTSVFKFIVSSVPYTDLWRGFDGHKDTWGGYTYERQIINNVFRYVPNVIVLSGDRHEFAATVLGTPQQWSGDGEAKVGDTGMIEFSTSPMSQFYLPIRTYIEELGAPHSKLGSGDLPLKYVQKGNSKYTMFEIDTTDTSKMTATAILKVDGKEVWRYEMVAKPLSPPMSIGMKGYSIWDLYRLALRFFA